MSDWLTHGFHANWAALSVQQPEKIDVTYTKLLSAAKWTWKFSFPCLEMYFTRSMKAPSQ